WEEKLYRESILRDEQLYRDQDGCSTINLLNGKTKKIQHRRRKKIVAVATPIAQSNQVIESMQAPHNHPTPENLVTQTPPLTNQNSVAVPTAAVAQPNQTDASSPKIALPENQSSLDNVAVKTPPKQSSSNNATVPTAREQSNADQGATQIPSRETNKESAVSTTANQSIDNSQPELATELKISPAKEKIEQSSNPEFSQSKQQFSLQNSNTPITPTQLKEQQTNNTTALISDSKPQSPSSTTTNSQVTPTQSEPQSPPNTTEPTLEQTPSNNQAEEQETNGWFRGRRKPDEPVPPPTLNWTKKQDVTLYQRSGRRRELEDKENKAIATAAVQLVKKYGIKADKQGKELTYQSDAFIINKKGDDYTISRRHDGKELMTFMANRWGEVRWVNLERDLSTNKYPINILPIERQEFLLVADYLKAGKELPRIDEDPRKLASVLSSVSPSGTHNVLESFKQSQVLQIMIGAIGNFKKNDLSLGNYRIVFREGKDKSTLQLFKTELNGSVREAVHFELLPTPNGMTHQVTKIGIDEADLEKLGSLARGLYINYDPLFPKLNAIRDIDLPVHPAIKKELDKLQSEQSPPSPPLTSASVNSLLSQQKREALSAGGEIPIRNSLLFAIHNSPNCELRIDNCELSSASPASPASPAPLASPASPAPNAEQSLDDLLSKLQKTGKLTIGEQRQLYNELIIESETQKEKTGKTDISLPPLDAIILDLKSQRQNIINDTYSGKVEIVSQSRQEIPQHTTTTNSPELEF
ncbi:MAG TPA: hypothetical protein V6D25_26165, partial [Leptolyngbyaceae cyanobacterium]